jgi:2,3-bisphosphoglycerate-dependent phosphoglycerate mutase
VDILEAVELHIEDERTLWVVRHGESTWNVLGLVQGQSDDPVLTRRGRRQSEGLAAHFRAAEDARGRRVGAVIASDLRRARQTAEILAVPTGLPVETDPRLRERSFGTSEGLAAHLLHAGVTGIRGDRVVDVDAHPDGGESLHDVYRRAATFVDQITRQTHGGDVVVVAHGGTVRAIRAYCAAIEVWDMTWDDVPNASAWRVRLPRTDPTHQSHLVRPLQGGVR